MALRFVGIDPDTDLEHCPTVWIDNEKGELVIQGWMAGSELRESCQSTTPARGSIPEGEEIIRIPKRMVPMIKKACDEIEYSGF